MQDTEQIFEVVTPLGFRVACSSRTWALATIKHPPLEEHLQEVQETLAQPLEVRRSRQDPAVGLFYGRFGSRLVCVVAKLQDGAGFVITAYPCDRMKVGEILWKS